ncbi:unnamed protein product [Effrenium voratum]|nr:unnamed protein product [Effrenium voratum]CAJ1437588.1 unnamed protein product [Effrenium voratum]
MFVVACVTLFLASLFSAPIFQWKGRDWAFAPPRQMPDDLAQTEPALQHLEWTKAMGNHQREEQLRAFLAEYPADLRRKVQEMQQALESKDYEALQEAAQQVMGSSSFVGATKLHDLASDLVEAVDLDSDDAKIAEKATAAVKEADALGAELIAAFAPKEKAQQKRQACCTVS